jgi:hypothetical protein
MTMKINILNNKEDDDLFDLHRNNLPSVVSCSPPLIASAEVHPAALAVFIQKYNPSSVGRVLRSSRHWVNV